MGGEGLGSGAISIRAVSFFGPAGTDADGGGAGNSAGAGVSAIGFLKTGAVGGLNDVDGDGVAGAVGSAMEGTEVEGDCDGWSGPNKWGDFTFAGAILAGAAGGFGNSTAQVAGLLAGGRDGRLIRTVSRCAAFGGTGFAAGGEGTVMRTVSFFGSFTSAIAYS